MIDGMSFSPEPEDTSPIRVYRLTLRLPGGTIVNETVDRYVHTPGKIFDLLCTAIAEKFDATVIDVMEIS